MKQPIHKQLAMLLSNYDYSYIEQTGTLIRKGIRGFCSDEIIPHKFRSIFAAVEYLIPIVREDEFSERYRKLTEEKPLKAINRNEILRREANIRGEAYLMAD